MWGDKRRVIPCRRHRRSDRETADEIDEGVVRLWRLTTDDLIVNRVNFVSLV